MARLEDLFVTYKSVRAKQKAKKNNFIPDFSNIGLFKNYFSSYYPLTKPNTTLYTDENEEGYKIIRKGDSEEQDDEKKK